MNFNGIWGGLSMSYTITPERAIEILDPEHREHYKSISPVNEACKIGMKAIKRSMVSERINYTADWYSKRNNYGELVYDTALCPECNWCFDMDDADWGAHYCPHCGQKLEWK